MTFQSEQILEQNLITQLVSNGYDKVTIKDETALLHNLKSQLEKHNSKTFSDSDFHQILNHLTKTNMSLKRQSCCAINFRSAMTTMRSFMYSLLARIIARFDLFNTSVVGNLVSNLN